MKVGKSIRKCIDEWQAGDPESAMLHACNAVDGTAKKIYPNLGNKARFTTFIRENYAIFGPMGLPGIDIQKTRWPVKVDKPTASGGAPDIADIIYSVHRCSHGHGDELPDGFDLTQDAAGEPERTTIGVAEGKVMLSDRILFAMIAICVVSNVNVTQKVPDGYFLTFARSERMLINDWWGRLGDFQSLVQAVDLPKLKMDFGDWMR